MSAIMTEPSKAFTVPAEVRKFLTRAPLLITESREDYDALFTAIAQTIIPENSLEWIATANYVDSTWEKRRLRYVKASIINATRHDALRTILESILPETDDRLEIAVRLAHEWFEAPDTRPAIMERLQKYDFDDDAVSAQALALRSPELEKIDRMMQQLEISAMAQLREIEFYRRASCWRTPKGLLQVVDAGAEPIGLQGPEV